MDVMAVEDMRHHASMLATSWLVTDKVTGSFVQGDSWEQTADLGNQVNRLPPALTSWSAIWSVSSIINWDTHVCCWRYPTPNVGNHRRWSPSEVESEERVGRWVGGGSRWTWTGKCRAEMMERYPQINPRPKRPLAGCNCRPGLPLVGSGSSSVLSSFAQKAKPSGLTTWLATTGYQTSPDSTLPLLHLASFSSSSSS